MEAETNSQPPDASEDKSKDKSEDTSEDTSEDASKTAHVPPETKEPPKFTDEEIDHIMQMGENIASKTVLNLLAETLRECGGNKSAAERLAARVLATCKQKGCGFVQMEFEETPLRLNITMTLVPKDHRMTIDIPSDSYREEVGKHIHFVRSTAVTWWKQYMLNYPALVSDIARLCPDIDFSELCVDHENPETLFFDATSKMRAGVFCYYVDRQNVPLIKKTDKST